jgi:DHA2 family multidrug resistance protein
MTALQATINAVPAANSTDTPAAPAVSATTWLAVVGATLGAFMAVLNIQIVNASLADIQGAIGAGIDDGGWISTSYLRWRISRARSAPASTTAAGSRPPI